MDTPVYYDDDEVASIIVIHDDDPSLALANALERLIGANAFAVDPEGVTLRRDNLDRLIGLENPDR